MGQEERRDGRSDEDLGRMHRDRVVGGGKELRSERENWRAIHIHSPAQSEPHMSYVLLAYLLP
jgi:hypothetical protein